MSRRPRQRPGNTRSERTLITPEGIPLTITVASRGARFGALTLDLIIIGVLMVATTIGLIYMAGGLANFDRMSESKTAVGAAIQFLAIVWIIAMFLFHYAYFLFFELGARSATIGKRLTGIRVAARDGRRLTAEMVIARNLLRDIELFMPVGFLIGGGTDSGLAWLAATGWFLIFMLFPLFNKDALRAGDVIAGTWVLERPRQKLQAALSAGVQPAAGTAPAAPAYRFDERELSLYGEFELQALERVLRDDRQDSLERVYQTIAAKIGREDGWNDERAFLEAYYTQLRARLETGMRMGRRKADKYSETSQ